MVLIQEGENMIKVQINNNIFYCELTFKPNFDVLVITASISKQHDFENILTSNGFMNIQYAIEKIFGFKKNNTLWE